VNAYIYQAALLCEHCANAWREGLTDTGDSDDYPQGPYSEGGGEADSPQHCDTCGLFLENPLTAEGVGYVEEAMREALKSGRLQSEALIEWAPFYGLDCV